MPDPGRAMISRVSAEWGPSHQTRRRRRRRWWTLLIAAPCFAIYYFGWPEGTGTLAMVIVWGVTTTAIEATFKRAELTRHSLVGTLAKKASEKTGDPMLPVRKLCTDHGSRPYLWRRARPWLDVRAP